MFIRFCCKFLLIHLYYDYYFRNRAFDKVIIDLHGERGGLQTMALAQRKEDNVEPFGGKSVLSLGNQIKMSTNIF